MEVSHGGRVEKRQRSFKNHEGNAEDNVDEKNVVYILPTNLEML